MSTESTLITAVIDAHEGRDVRICNIPGAFLDEYMEDNAIMALCVWLTELMVNNAPQIYRQHVIYEKLRTIL